MCVDISSPCVSKPSRPLFIVMRCCYPSCKDPHSPLNREPRERGWMKALGKGSERAKPQKQQSQFSMQAWLSFLNFSCLLNEFSHFLFKWKAYLPFLYHLHFTLQDQVILEMSNSTAFICDIKELVYLFFFFLQHTHYPGIPDIYKWHVWDWQGGGGCQ